LRKLVVLLLVSALIISGVGCSGSGDNFKEVDDVTREGLIALLQAAALGGCGEYAINVDVEIGAGSVGDVTGSVSGNLAEAEIVSISFLEDKLIEVSRGEISPEGKWGPLTMLYGPKAFVMLEGEAMKGYYIPGPRFAAVLVSAGAYSDFLVNPRDTGLVALALIHGGKLQEAADLLAGLQTIHPLLSGLPAKADIFGRPQGDAVDYAATAWAGYAAAVLAKAASDNPDLWNEARAYASYLEAIAVPEDNETRLAGWLLFTELSRKSPDSAGLAEKWQLEPGETYDPLVGTWMLLSGRKIKKYVDFNYVPVSQTDKWIHYNLLAFLNKLPAEPDLAVSDVFGGKAVTENGEISLQATSWMLIALQGGLTN
jgi:hypothetical protein